MEKHLNYSPLDEERMDLETRKYFYGNRLTLLRVIRGVSLSDVAESLGISTERVAHYEGQKIKAHYNKGEECLSLDAKSVPCNQPSISMLGRLCSLFNVKPSFFYDEELSFSSTITFTGINVSAKDFNGNVI